MTTATQLLKSLTARVMPAKAGICGGNHERRNSIALDPGFRWGDGEAE